VAAVSLRQTLISRSGRCGRPLEGGWSRPEIGDSSGDVYVVKFPARLSTPSLNKRCQRRSCSPRAAWN